MEHLIHVNFCNGSGVRVKMTNFLGAIQAKQHAVAVTEKETVKDKCNTYGDGIVRAEEVISN